MVQVIQLNYGITPLSGLNKIFNSQDFAHSDYSVAFQRGENAVSIQSS